MIIFDEYNDEYDQLKVISVVSGGNVIAVVEPLSDI